MKQYKKTNINIPAMTPAKENGLLNLERKKIVVSRLLDKKFDRSGKPHNDDCDSCGERCFD